MSDRLDQSHAALGPAPDPEPVNARLPAPARAWFDAIDPVETRVIDTAEGIHVRDGQGQAASMRRPSRSSAIQSLRRA